jgi:hypothetical protein
MKRTNSLGRVLVVAAVVFYFAGVAAAGTHVSREWNAPAPASRLAHRAAVEFKDLVLDGVHISHRILCGAAKLYARLCIECTEIATDRILIRRG